MRLEEKEKMFNTQFKNVLSAFHEGQIEADRKAEQRLTTLLEAIQTPKIEPPRAGVTYKPPSRGAVK